MLQVVLVRHRSKWGSMGFYDFCLLSLFCNLVLKIDLRL